MPQIKKRFKLKQENKSLISNFYISIKINIKYFSSKYIKSIWNKTLSRQTIPYKNHSVRKMCA